MTETAPNKIRADKFEARLILPDIIYIRFKENSVVKDMDVFQAIAVNKTLTNGAVHKRIIEPGKYTTITSSARKHLEQEGTQAIAEAFVLSSLAQKIIFRVYQKLRKQKHPIS